MKKDYEREGFHLQRLYKRRSLDSNGLVRSTFGLLRSAEPYIDPRATGVGSAIGTNTGTNVNNSVISNNRNELDQNYITASSDRPQNQQDGDIWMVISH